MLTSIALILLIGFTLSGILGKLGLPGLLGMVATGIILGPYGFDLISPEILDISAELRQIALIVILARAGLSLDLKDLKKVGRPAFLLCFVPATFELLTVTLLAPSLLGVTRLEAAILGAVLAAVSPAVVVPRMLHLMESGYGRDKKIPQMIMAGASVDDVYVIVLFTAFLGMHGGSGFDAASLVKVPVSVVSGIAVGILAGYILVRIFKMFHMRDTIKVLIILSVSMLMVSVEELLKPWFPMSGLLAVMAIGGTILKTYELLAKRIMGKFSKIWVGSEILLFVLVGAAVNITALGGTGVKALILIFSALIVRMLGVAISVSGTDLTLKERLFCAIAYLPKATVQAAIGSIPLAMGVPAGGTILSVAVLAIMVTAPLGAIGIDKTYKVFLTLPTEHLNN
ncbi:cation:proton antiporter [Youngiibacter multivorans]|uniref:NhaP-type Na+/H+ or K+/H+ antiporter n=1 Tax=Youngiibacter multivorans TaxID=937251 RepID=A0ABS4G8L0_9CLOT|nr:cation:proton antiporter [Youngiibacter multivorans]MBP1920881.1 NhaP-type Na+/H+ or K+/H+ antiporter [Youngiibacter multivorans]